MSLPQAQNLEELFYSRGYVRRQDLDVAGTVDSASFALLGWEKPGVPVTQEAPVIRILSKDYFDGDLGRRVIATQAFGGVVWDSAGVLSARATGYDAPVAIVELVPLGAPGAIAPDPGKLAQTRDDAWAYRFAYHEGPGGVGTMAKQGWAVSCPYVRSVSHYTIAGAAALAGGYVKSPWIAAGLAVAARAADGWVDAKLPCH